MGQGIAEGAGLAKTLGGGLPLSSLACSASFALLCFFYAFAAGTYLQVTIYPLVDRVTYYTYFEFHVVNEFVDNVVIGSLLILWLLFSIKRSKVGYSAIGVLTVAFVAITLSGSPGNVILDGVALSSLPIILILLIRDRRRSNGEQHRRMFPKWQRVLAVNYLSILGMIIGVITLASAITSIFVLPSSGTTDAGVQIRDYGYGYQIFLLLSTLSPALMLLLIAALPVKLIVNAMIRSNREKEIKGANRAFDASDDRESYSTTISSKSKVTYVFLSVMLSIVVVLIPHSYPVNPDGQLIGVDTEQYAIWLDELGQSSGIQDFMHSAFVELGDGDRPLSFIIIYGFLEIVSAGSERVEITPLLEYLPIILAPSLVLVVYFLTRELSSNDLPPLFAAFVTAISFQTLIGIYAGFYANWIALIFGYLSVVFLLRYLKKGTLKNLFLFAVLILTTLLTHVYTWSILAIVIGLFTAVCIVKPNILNSSNTKNDRSIGPPNFQASLKRDGRNGAAILLLILIGTVAVDIGRTYLTGSSGGIEKELEFGDGRVGTDQFISRWNNLTYGVTTYVGGMFANFIILGLGVYWLAASRSNWSKNAAAILIILFLSVGILPFLFGQWVVQTRVFYNIPFQIPAALGLSMMVSKNNTSVLTRPLHQKYSVSSTSLISIAVLVWLATMATIAVSNFYLVSK